MFTFLILKSNSAIFAADRFSKNTDGSISDNVTGLVWQAKDDGKRYEHKNAIRYCENLNAHGKNDWRLPSVKELFSITDDTRSSPAADPILGMIPVWYWSSSVDASYSARAWYVDFGDGSVDRDYRTFGFRVRCVRSGK